MGSVVAPEKLLCYEEFSTEYSEIKLKLALKCLNFDKASWWYKVLASAKNLTRHLAVKSLAKCCDRGDLTSILPEERTVSILCPFFLQLRRPKTVAQWIQRIMQSLTAMMNIMSQ
jgi:hypothetical protein